MQAMSQTKSDLMDFDPFGMAFRRDPRSFDERLIKSSPGFMDMEGVPSAFVATYAQTAQVLRDFKSFSSLKPKGLPGMERIDFFNGLPVMNYSDPPDHTRRRRIVAPAFSPKRLEELLAAAKERVDELISKALAAGSFEAIGDLTKPLSIHVLLRCMLGVADEDQHIFMTFVSTIPLLDALRPGDPKPKPYLDAWEAGVAYCRQQKERARREKSDNLIAVIAESAEGGALDDNEMMAMMIVLLIGGVSTMAAATGSALLNMTRYPELAERIRREPAAASNLFEETLRTDPVVSLVMRFATADVELGGKQIRKGMPVYALIGVACHDPAVFPEPYRFDIDRPNVREHVAFGHGIHTCIGSTVTRSVVPVLIQAVATRMPGIALADRKDALEYDISTPRARHLSALRLTAG